MNFKTSICFFALMTVAMTKYLAEEKELVEELFEKLLSDFETRGGLGFGGRPGRGGRGGHEKPIQEGLTKEELRQFVVRDSECTEAKVKVNKLGPNITIVTNAFPDHKTGCVNPMKALPFEDTTWVLSAEPKISPTPYCLSMNTIGIAKNGVSFFTPLNGQYINAVNGSGAETMDCCNGHPNEKSFYHYHQLPFPKNDNCDQALYETNSGLVFLGVALDGFPIYGTDETEHECIDSLDECSGTSDCRISNGRYIYIAVKSRFPYILGCFRGEPRHAVAYECDFTDVSEDENTLCICDDETLTGTAKTYDDLTLGDRGPPPGEDLVRMLRRLLNAKLNGNKKSLQARSNGYKKRDYDSSCYPSLDCSDDDFEYDEDTQLCDDGVEREPLFPIEE